MIAIARIQLISIVPLAICLCASPGSLSRRAETETQLRLGIIGLDTSHVIEFTKLLNDPMRPDHVPGARVVAAFKGGSPDVEASATRIDRFTAELTQNWKVRLADSIEELCREVDAVLLMSVDGRTHLRQVRPVFAAKKRVFIDKPFAASLHDAREIVRLSLESGAVFFSSSSLRFVSEVQDLKNNTALGNMVGAFTYGPAPIEPHHPDLFWYGIHSIEMLYTLMGPGCESVTRLHTNGADVVVGRWKDGRTGVVRGIREGATPYGAVAFGSKGVVATRSPMKTDYHGLVTEIVKFFQTGAPPVSSEETLEIMAFMEAADLSKMRHGAPVALSELKTR
jgi:predicted dehydrogenase